MACLLLRVSATYAKSDRCERRPVNTARVSNLQEERLVRLFEGWAIKHYNAICPLSWAESPPAESIIGYRKLLGRTPPGLLE
jgi:hypothetical protein